MNNRVVIKTVPLALVIAAAPVLAAQDQPEVNRKNQGAATERQAQPPAAGQGQTQPSQPSQPSQAQRQPSAEPGSGALPEMKAEQATELSQSALAHITSASAALANKETSKAQSALDTAANSLRTLYTAVPGGPVLSNLGSNRPGEPLNLAPVMSEMRTRSVWMDPEVVAGVEQAQREADKGNEKAAQNKLSLARQRLEADIALLPIEDVYARVQAAREELRQGRPENARRLLRNVPVTLTLVQVSTPLVPVRFNLRAAAVAAEQGNWDQAKQLVNQASESLTQMANEPTNADVQKELQPIAERADKLSARLDKGQKPRPKEIRDLARQTKSVAKTL